MTSPFVDDFTDDDLDLASIRLIQIAPKVNEMCWKATISLENCGSRRVQQKTTIIPMTMQLVS